MLEQFGILGTICKKKHTCKLKKAKVLTFVKRTVRKNQEVWKSWPFHWLLFQQQQTKPAKSVNCKHCATSLWNQCCQLKAKMWSRFQIWFKIWWIFISKICQIVILPNFAKWPFSTKLGQIIGTELVTLTLNLHHWIHLYDIKGLYCYCQCLELRLGLL